MLVIVMQLARLALENRVRLSAKNKYEIFGPPVVMMMGSRLLDRTTLSNSLDSFSMQRMKRSGYIGSSCPIPLVEWK